MNRKGKQDAFDFGEGERRAEQGMNNAANAPRTYSWQEDAGRWYMSLPVGAEFSSDDLIKAIGLPDEGQNKNNAVGAFFQGLARAHYILYTGKTTKSERVDRHTGLNRIWVKQK